MEAPANQVYTGTYALQDIVMLYMLPKNSPPELKYIILVDPISVFQYYSLSANNTRTS